MKIGVLALQGDFEAHALLLDQLGATPTQVRRAAELAGLSGLIIPGGESTTMLKLLEAEALLEPLAAFASQRPVFGTCAGVILMAREVTRPSQKSLGLIDIAVERNAYGRQADSSFRTVDLRPAFAPAGEPPTLRGVFIRAPIIRSAGPDVSVLAMEGSDPVLVRQGRHLAATFHPELSDDRRVHQFFLNRICDGG